MAQYALIKALNPGGGTITINGNPNQLFYEEGVELEVEISIFAGFTGVDWYLNGVFVSSSETFTFFMPSQTSYLEGRMSGEYTPVANYGLKYSKQFKQNTGPDARCIGLEIYLDGYEGDPAELELESINYTFGNVGGDPLDVVIGSSVDFVVAATTGQFDEFLEGGNRDWKVVLLDDSVVFWTGFINADFLTTVDRSGKRLQKFTAMDGIKSMGSVRVDQRIFPNGNDRLLAIAALVGSLNQSFKEFRNTNIVCNIHETRMDREVGLFEQFLTPDNAIFTDGEVAKFTKEGVVENETLYISEVLERLINPFQCRVFLYADQFWIVRTPDLNKPALTGFVYTPDGNVSDSFEIDNTLEINCSINNPERTSRRVYTSFTSLLKLGVLFNETRGAVYEADFDNTEWHSAGTNQTDYPPHTSILDNWGYVRAIPSIQPTSVPTGDVARVQYSAGTFGDNCKIWTTANGASDPNISYIFLNTDGTGKPLIVTEEGANKISVALKFMLLAVSSDNPNVEANQQIGFMIKIGDSYLERTGTNTFGWTTTENIVLFNGSNSYVVNTIAINNLVVPETGTVEARLYQLITASGPRHLYAINYDSFELKIEQNETFQLSEISRRAVTDAKHTYIHPEYETFIGDARTNMSTSAIRLDITDNPVSELWTRDGIEEIELLDMVCIDLANLKGLRNRRIIGTLERVKPYPYQPVIYSGSYWMVLAIEWDCFRDKWKVELFELGVVPVIEWDINWELSEYDTPPNFVDANMRIKVNGVTVLEEFGNSSGTITAVDGDSIDVEYFYLDLMVGSPVDPKIELLIDGVIVGSHPVVPGTSDLFTYNFVLDSSKDLLVRALG